MDGLRISYLIDHPEYIPQLGKWLFDQWGAILGEETPTARIEKLKTHLNRDRLPIAWVAHGYGRVLGTAALRVHDLDDRPDLTPWLGGVLVGPHFRRRGIGEALCVTVENGARARGIETLYLFTLDLEAWYSRLGWKPLGACVWHARPGVIMSKHLPSR